MVEHWDDGTSEGAKAVHRYLNMLKAQMSDDELCLVFYDAVSHFGLDKHYEHRFKNMLDSLGFLENIHAESLISPSHHHLYASTEFRFLNRDERAAKDVR